MRDLKGTRGEKLDSNLWIVSGAMPDATLRPVYTCDFCGDFSHSDACDWVTKVLIYIASHRWSNTFVSEYI